MTDEQTIMFIVDKRPDRCKVLTGTDKYDFYQCDDIATIANNIIDVKVLKNNKEYYVTNIGPLDGLDALLLKDTTFKVLPQEWKIIFNKHICNLHPCIFSGVQTEGIAKCKKDSFIAMSQSIPNVQHRYQLTNATTLMDDQPWIDTLTTTHNKYGFYPSKNGITDKSFLLQLRHVKRDKNGKIINKSAPSRVYTVEIDE